MKGLRLTLEWVAGAVGGRVTAGDVAEEVGDISIDSRTLHAGDFFVALHGAAFDGHAFVGEAFARGACGAMVERNAVDLSEPHAVVEVDDTTRALQDLAHAVRREAGARVVAITGSAGKTTTKEAVAEFLSSRYRVVKNKGNLNNHIGLPLSLMQLRDRPDVAVMELGMNHQGEISTLVRVAEPDVRVWTNVGDAHLGFFDSSDAIADAKAEILELADRDTALVCNADDTRVMARVTPFAGRTVTFGILHEATVQASEVEDLGVEGMRAHVSTPAGERTLETPLIGRSNLSNVLAATAVALDCEVELDDIVSRAAKLHPAERRGAVRRFESGVTLIDDSYNSSPSALRGALDVLAKEARAPRRVAVLGEMLELGGHALPLHRECGKAAAAAGLGLLFTIGGEGARTLAGAAVAAGMPETSVRHFETSEGAAGEVAGTLRSGDLVLVKGSRSTRTDLVADRIAVEFG